MSIQNSLLKSKCCTFFQPPPCDGNVPVILRCAPRCLGGLLVVLSWPGCGDLGLISCSYISLASRDSGSWEGSQAGSVVSGEMPHAAQQQPWLIRTLCCQVPGDSWILFMAAQMRGFEKWVSKIHAVSRSHYLSIGGPLAGVVWH